MSVSYTHLDVYKRQSVDTASEALAVSLAEKAKIDLDFMGELTGKDKDTLTAVSYTHLADMRNILTTIKTA